MDHNAEYHEIVKGGHLHKWEWCGQVSYIKWRCVCKAKSHSDEMPPQTDITYDTGDTIFRENVEALAKLGKHLVYDKTNDDWWWEPNGEVVFDTYPTSRIAAMKARIKMEKEKKG